MPLSYEVFITPPLAFATKAPPPPDGAQSEWNPLSTTLISGERDAVLVDPPFTIKETEAVAQWFAGKNKRLTHIFVTHGHGDHWFGAASLLKRFGGVVVASAGTIKEMEKSRVVKDAYWGAIFPGHIPADIAIEPLAAESFALEGETLAIVEAGHTDTDASTFLHVPSLDLLVAGDVVYDGPHQMLAEGAGDGLEQWLKAVDIAESYKPKLIVAGHKVAGHDDDAARILGETRAYLQTAVALRSSAADPAAWYKAMREKFPQRTNPHVAWFGALALYK
ncbi:uncharacterized protein LOC62_05G007228 [Vanrija pseudolonga]|uniref:Metallo-beta-lactamase domain-containing protein n=1 Tax=Vanrija pseudolonga TaxID=143232 RepID=A0AAF0YHI8_9TREE|nr:hypothetical protein LOC62_05G007228 [Vanrija pseudolonga]